MIRGIGNTGKIKTEFLIESHTTGTTSKGGNFLKMKLRCKEGTADGVIWDYDETKDYAKHLGVGKVAILYGSISTYNGEHQLKIETIEKGISDSNDYIKKSQFNVEEMYNSITEVIQGFKEPLTKLIALGLLNKFSREEIYAAPAATSVHNNWYGGLLEHITSMLVTGKAISVHYKKNYYPELSIDKVLFGVIAHDLGKIEEYSGCTAGYPKTVKGVLANHIVLGPCMIYSIASEYFSEQNKKMSNEDYLEVLKLMHLVASHHGQMDWGSPVKPATIEAVILHHLDNLDSKVLHALDVMKEPDPSNPELSKYSKFEGVQYIINSNK